MAIFIDNQGNGPRDGDARPADRARACPASRMHAFCAARAGSSTISTRRASFTAMCCARRMPMPRSRGIDTACGARAAGGARGLHRRRSDGGRDRAAALHRPGGDGRADDRAAALCAGARTGAACRRSGGLRRRRHARASRATPPSWSRSITGLLPAVVDAPAALAPGAPRLWDEAPGNLSYRFERGDKAAVAAAIAAGGACRRDRAGQQPPRRRADRAARGDRQLRRGRRQLRPAADRAGRAQHPQPARRVRVPAAARAHPASARPMSAAGSA